MRRFLQFRLRTLFVVTTLAALLAFAVAPSIKRYMEHRRQQRFPTTVQRTSGIVDITHLPAFQPEDDVRGLVMQHPLVPLPPNSYPMPPVPGIPNPTGDLDLRYRAGGIYPEDTGP